MQHRLLITLSAVALLAGCGGATHPRGPVSGPPPPPTPTNVGLMVTADGGGALTVIDNAARSITRTIPLAGTLRDIVGTSDGRTVIVIAQVEGSDRALQVDVRTGETLLDVALGEDLGASSVARTPDGRTLVVTETSRDLLILDSALDETKRIPLGETARDLLALDDKRAAIAAGDALILVPLDGGDSKRINVFGPAFSLTLLGADRVAVAVAKPPAVALVTLKDGSVKTAPVSGAEGIVAVSAFPDGSAVVATDGGLLGKSIGTDVHRVSSADAAVSLFAGNVGQGPRAVLVDGAGVSWIANYQSSTVTVLKPDGSFIVELPTQRHPSAITKVSAVQPPA